MTIAVTVMHVYVFWRSRSVPFLKRHISLKLTIGIGVILWLTFFAGRVFGHGGSGPFAAALEFFGMNWMGALFIIATTLLSLDIITGFGFLLPRLSPSLRGLALGLGGLLSVIALFQGMRPPMVLSYDVYLSGLPDEMNGTVLIAMSDTHFGSLIDERWLKARVDQIQEQKPDIVVLPGDIFEGHGRRKEELIPVLRCISAPLGVWAVRGNHESHDRWGTSSDIMNEAGIQTLTNTWVEISPGFILAGVDDISDRRRYDQGSDPITKTLNGRPPGATILLSHKPLLADRAERAGAGLMLSGHTHGGQVWPFSYLVKHDFPLLAGRYEVGGMTVIVSRGAGTWGPRMRLWHPGDILRVTLHTKMEK